jgi:hypothetical protein
MWPNEALDTNSLRTDSARTKKYFFLHFECTGIETGNYSEAKMVLLLQWKLKVLIAC